MEQIYPIITAGGGYIPSRIVTNEAFLKNRFYDQNRILIRKMNEEIIVQFEKASSPAVRFL